MTKELSQEQKRVWYKKIRESLGLSTLDLDK